MPQFRTEGYARDKARTETVLEFYEDMVAKHGKAIADLVIASIAKPAPKKPRHTVVRSDGKVLHTRQAIPAEVIRRTKRRR